MTLRVLVVEDDREIRSLMQSSLSVEGFEVQTAVTLSEAEALWRHSPPDVIVLDLGLPDGDGLDLLRQWRASGFNEPVLILSARDAREDRVAGLNLGADDYLPKPFGMDELLARLRSLLRRQAGVKTTVLAHGEIRVDLLARTVTHRGQRVVLTNREFALVELFLQNPGRVLTRTFIAERVWQASYDLGTNLIDVYVRRLRQKLETPGERPFIQTVRGMGYQLA